MSAVEPEIEFDDAPPNDNGEAKNTSQRLQGLSTPPYGQMPAWIFRNGVWASMTTSQMRVYGVLVHLADNHTGRIEGRTQAYIGRLAGVAPKRVYEITKSLNHLGLIEKKGKKNWTNYRVLRTLTKDINDIETSVKFFGRQFHKSAVSHRRGQKGRFVRKPAPDLSVISVTAPPWNPVPQHNGNPLKSRYIGEMFPSVAVGSEVSEEQYPSELFLEPAGV